MHQGPAHNVTDDDQLAAPVKSSLFHYSDVFTKKDFFHVCILRKSRNRIFLNSLPFLNNQGVVYFNVFFFWHKVELGKKLHKIRKAFRSLCSSCLVKSCLHILYFLTLPQHKPYQRIMDLVKNNSSNYNFNFKNQEVSTDLDIPRCLIFYHSIEKIFYCHCHWSCFDSLSLHLDF